METLLEQETSNDRTELDVVQEPSVSQVTESADYQYEQLDNSSGRMYDRLRVQAETHYEEFPSNGT